MKHLKSCKFDGMDESFQIKADTFTANILVDAIDEEIISFDIDGCGGVNLRSGILLDQESLDAMVEEVSATVPAGALTELNKVIKVLWAGGSPSSLFKK